jgi:hypothetical protein
MVGVVAFGLASCKGEDNAAGTAAGDATATTQGAESHGHDHGDGDASHGHTHGEGGQAADGTILGAEEPAQDADSDGQDQDQAASMSQESAEGTVALFLDALKEGDFEGALAVSDPTSIGYDSLAQIVEGLRRIEGNPDQQKVQDLVMPFLTEPWQKVSTEAVSIRDERAKYSINFANGNSAEVDVVKNEGLWVMFLPEGILDEGTKTKSTGIPDGQAGS